MFPRVFNRKKQVKMGTTTAATTAGDDGMALPSASSFATAPCTATAPDVQGPAITPPRTGTLKNTILFATKIASNASVPWLKFVTDTVIQIVERVEEMKSNEEAARSLEGDIKAFLYIITRAATLDPAVEIVDEFVQRVQSIRDQMPAPGKSFLDFSNAEKTKDIITGLSNGLDKAVQLFQTGLQISLVKSMGEFMTWQAKLEHKNGDAVRNILDVEYNVDGDAKMTAEGVGTTTTTVERSKFAVQGTYTQSSKGRSVTDTYKGSTFNVKGDLNLSTIATG